MVQNRELRDVLAAELEFPRSIVQLELGRLASPAPGSQPTCEPWLLPPTRGGSMQSAPRPCNRSALKRESDSTVHPNGDSAVVEIERRKRLAR